MIRIHTRPSLHVRTTRQLPDTGTSWPQSAPAGLECGGGLQPNDGRGTGELATDPSPPDSTHARADEGAITQITQILPVFFAPLLFLAVFLLTPPMVVILAMF